MASKERSRQKALARQKAKRKAAVAKGPGRESIGPGSSPAARMKRAAAWPLREAWVSSGWQQRLQAVITVARDRPDGRVAFGAYLVDLGCLGLKNAFATDGVSLSRYEARLRDAPDGQVRCSPSLAVKIIQTGIAYAAELGFQPPPRSEYAMHILAGIDPSDCEEEVVCGSDGQPLYVAGPNDDAAHILRHLVRRLGSDGFHFIAPL